MNTFELEKVLNTFKPQEWDTGVFARNELRSPTEKCVFIYNTDCSHNEGTHWVALSINDQGERLYFDSYGLPPVFKEFSTFFEGHICTMMFNCKDLSHCPVDITVHYLLSTPLLAAACRRLSTGWRNTVMTRLKTL